ncbi:MAG: hypothetical protein ACWGQW_04765, partial [bacterium]
MKRIAFFLTLLLAAPALAENISYVRAGCTYNGNGNYSYCAASGGADGAYNSLSNWNTGEARTLSEIEHVYLYSESSAADTSFPVSLSGSWVDSASNYVILEAGDDHGGVWDDTVYHAVTSATTGSTTMIGFGGDVLEHTKIIGLQFYDSSTTHDATNRMFYFAGDSNAYEISKCIFKGNPSYSVSGYQRNIFYIGRASATSGTTKIWNNLFYDWQDAAGVSNVMVVNYTAASTLVMSTYNNTFVNIDNYGIYNSTTNVTVYSYNNGFSSVGVAKNANVSGGTGDSTSTPTFVGGGDNHLNCSTDTTWKANGTNDPGSGLYSDDIDGETRPATWSTGADDCPA